ncbi:MAG: TonB-dependent receptor [Pseudomonadales bacterium]|nr:TonB-dependent receptor [Pseudomonadales bacterium]
MVIDQSKKTRRLLVSALTAAIAGVIGSSVAMAQEQQQESNAGALEEISVTGSRIRQSGFETPTPVTTVQASELSSMAPGQLIDAFNQLPQFLANDSPSTAASKADSAGAANLNLRGIGSNRTLVLLNGRRVVPSNRLSRTDINLFPESLVQRVDVVTGGASAAYGADAVAGVVNFILDTDFTGIDAHTQGGITQRGDNENWEGSLAFGADLSERTHLLFSADVFQSNRLETLKDRKWFKGIGNVRNPAWTAAVASGQCQANVFCAAGPQDIIAPNVVSTEGTFGGLINAPGSALNRLTFLSDGSATPFVQSDLSALGGTRSQSIAPQFGGGSGDDPVTDRGGSFVPENERASAFMYLDYDATDNLNFFIQGIWGNNRTNSVGTLPLGTGTRAVTIFQDNAFLPENLRQTMIQEGRQSFTLQRFHTTADIARDRFINENNTFSGTIGMKADIDSDGIFDSGWFSGWHMDLFYQAGRNENRLHFIDFIRRDNLPLAADAVVDPATGSIVCNITRFDPSRSCVPINLFGAGRASQEAIDFVLDGDATIRANTTQHFAEFSSSGQVWEGWGAGAISAAFGASYRKDKLTQQVVLDDSLQQGSPTPVNDPANGIRGIPSSFAGKTIPLIFTDIENIQGGFTVKEAFVEVNAPVISDMLDISMAGRWADYSRSGTIWAYKTTTSFQVLEDLRLRFTASRDIRAGNLSELFDRQQQGVAVNDPQFGGAATTASQIFGGNPEVSPEKAFTYTTGLVYQPAWLDGFSVSADYYRIRIKGAIGQFGVQNIVDECFETAGASALCAQITRDPTSNALVTIENTFLNLNKSQVEGVDVEMAYNTDLNLFGSEPQTLSWRFFGTWLNENSVTNLGAAKRDVVGETGFSDNPEFRFTTNVTYNYGPFRAFLQERWVDKGKLDIDEVEGIQIDDNSVRAAFYTDLRLSYTQASGDDGEWEVYGHIANLFDENPPVVANFSIFSGNSTGNDSLFDILGRRFTAGFRFRY